MDRPPENPFEMTVEAFLAARPEAAPMFVRQGMACVGCVMARFETVAEAADQYGVDPCSLLPQHRPACRVKNPRR